MTNDQRPVADLSPRVVSLAREIDRLPPGEYVVRLVKPDLAALSWQASIERVEPIRNMTLSKKEGDR